MEIDPYAALIALARSDSILTDIVGQRIDIWHRYGQSNGDWSTSDSSLIFVPRGGVVRVDVEWGRPIFEARCYASSPFKCGQLWLALMDFTVSHNEPRVIAIDAGNALVNYVLPQGGQGMPRLLFDEEVKPNGGLPYYSVGLESEISFNAVT